MSTQLYLRSIYTLLSSMCTVKGLAEKARSFGYDALALVDRNVLSGAMVFKKECAKTGIKAIYGMETDVEADDRIFPVVLYAANDEGFTNLMKLSSHININDLKTVDPDTLKRYLPGNIVLLLSDAMPLTYAIDRNGDIEGSLERQRELFGDRYVVGLADHDIAINARRDIKVKSVLKEKGIMTVALSRTFYPEKDDYREYEILKCIRDKRTVDKDVCYEEGRHFLNREEFAALYDEDDIRNADKLASMCNVESSPHTSLPHYPTPEGVSSRDYLIALCREGLKRRLKGKNDGEYTRRLEYELKTIIDMHFEDYFLIVYDFILYAKKNGIMVGPGRGSAAGSLVSYCLGITDIDPLRYGLLFERFLNPERISMPDIDTDFPDDRRSEMFSYVRDRYGIEHVGHIMAYGTMKARQVIRDVGRALNYSNSELDLICKSIPYTYYNTTLSDAYNSSALFRQRIESQQKYRDLYKTALKLEGFPRHETVHPAGVVMSSLPLSEVVPLARVESDLYSTQYTMEHLEDLGLIKMDFLGLRNLGIIAEISEDIRNNVDAAFRIKDIPLDDEKTFRLINNVDLLGVFQLESSGMQNLARKMRPRTFEELGMMIALFRPGPMDNIPLFLENRAHPEKIRYPVPELKPILEETYGIIVYQEQIMTIARVMAGFTYGKADILRKAMSKKKAAELEGLRNDFIEGCIRNGYDRSVAVSVYELVLKFANYGFNKSHSIAYAMVAYQLAYLKANYPVWFYKALLNGVIGSQTKTYEYIKECHNVSQTVMGISVNRSTDTYTVEDGAIRMPFGVCKDVGSVSTVKIIEERKNGDFKNYLDCVCRLTNKGVEKNVIENLIYAGAFDEFGLSRHTMSNALVNALKYAQAHRGEISLIADLGDEPIIEELRDDMQVRADNEKKVLGFYFSFNPILDVKKKNSIDTLPLRQLIDMNGYVKGFGMIRRVKTHRTRKGDMMCFIDLSDDSGDISLAVMPNLYRDHQEELVKENYLYFEGELEKEASVLVRKLRKI